METGLQAVVGRGLVEILPDFRKWGQQLAADMRTARTQFDGTTAGLKASAATVGKSMASIGKGTSALGLGVAAVSVKMASDFQAHTAVLQTAAGETTKGLAVVREGIKNIAVGTGTGIQNLTDGMYTIEKAGYRGSAGLQVLKAAAQGAREENAKLSDVTNAMTSIMASYHLGASKSVQVMNAMKTAAGEGKITMEEFSGAMSTVLPIASANHIAFEQVAGAVATLTQHGTSAREATHELGATIRALASPNLVASREMARFGLSSVDLSKNLGKRGLTGTVDLLVNTILRQMGPAGTRLQKVLEGTRQSSQDVQVMLSHMPDSIKGLANQYLTGTMSAHDFAKASKEVSVENKPMLRNFITLVDRSRGFSRELKNGGPAQQTFTDALKKMSGGAIGLNTILQLSGESFGGFKERVDKVGESFHNNSKDVEGWKQTSQLLSVQMDRVKAQVQVLAINIGTKLIPVVSAVVGFFAKHQSVLIAVAGAIGTFLVATSAAYIGMKLYAVYTGIASAATWAFSTANGASRAQVLGLRLQLAALWVQQKLVAAWSGIVTAAQWAWNVAMDASPIGLIILGIAALVAVIVVIATKTQWFQKLWHAIWGGLKTAVSVFVGWLKNNWQLVVWTILTGGIGLAVAMIVRHWGAVKHAFSATIDWIKKAVPGAYHAVVDWFVRMGRDIGGFFSRLPGQLGGFFSGLWTAISGFFSKLPGQIGGFFSRLPGQLGGFFSGLWSSISGFFTALPGKILSTALRWNYVLNKGGEQLIEGLFNGATDFFTKSVPDFFKSVWHGIVDFFKAVFGIHSPSTVMASLGVNLIEGLFSGMLTILTTISEFLNTHVVRPVVHFFTVSIPSAAGRMGALVVAGWDLLRSGVAAVYNWVYAHVISPIVHFFTVSIPSAAGHMWTMVVAEWGLLRDGVSAAYGWVRNHVFSPIGNFFTKTIPGWARSLKNAVVSRWNDLYDGLLTVHNWLYSRIFNPIGNFFTKTIPGWARSLKNAVVSRWHDLYDGLLTVHHWLYSRIFNPIGNFFTKTIPGWARTLKDKVVGFFGDMRDGLGRVWSGIKDKAKTPINWVLDHVWNHGIVSVWGKIAGWIGMKNSLGTVKLLAAGGTVGREPFGIFNKPTAIVGEGNSAYPEYVIPTDPRYAGRAKALWQAAGVHFMENGGILGSIGHAIGSAISSTISFGKSAMHFFEDPVGQAKKLLLGPLGGIVGAIGHNSWARMAARLPSMAVDGLVQAVKKVGSSLLSAVGAGSSGGSGVQQWAPVTRMILRLVGQPDSLLGITLRRMNQESGGNPTAVNRYDINWQQGHPSVGLMQVIGPTFDSYAGPFRNTGPFMYGVSVNPAANIYASMKYALGAYGSLASAYGRAGGYRLGTMGATGGWHWLGEDGPELAKLPAGTRIRSSRDSARPAVTDTRALHFTLHNHGVLGSKQEVENWLVDSLTTVKRKGRMP